MKIAINVYIYGFAYEDLATRIKNKSNFTLSKLAIQTLVGWQSISIKYAPVSSKFGFFLIETQVD